VVRIDLIAAVHKLQDAAPALRVFFALCLILVSFAGVYVFCKRKELFGRDPHVTNDSWASRNLRLWQVLLVWVLAMELLIEMLIRV
jgi:hypothetical protein